MYCILIKLYFINQQNHVKQVLNITINLVKYRYLYSFNLYIFCDYLLTGNKFLYS